MYNSPVRTMYKNWVHHTGTVTGGEIIYNTIFYNDNLKQLKGIVEGQDKAKASRTKLQARRKLICRKYGER